MSWLPISTIPIPQEPFDYSAAPVLVWDGRMINIASAVRIYIDSNEIEFRRKDSDGRAVYPTHWMPLPDSPSEDTAARKESGLEKAAKEAIRVLKPTCINYGGPNPCYCHNGQFEGSMLMEPPHQERECYVTDVLENALAAIANKKK